MKLSIITVNLNNKDGLQKTIDSVISQTFKGFEWIVIDGGSTDGSKELIEKYADHISYWVSEPDKGIYNAMNKGIRVAKGEYIEFLNSGDLYFNEKTLETVNRHLSHSDIIYGSAIIRRDGKDIRIHMQRDICSFYDLVKKPINHQSSFIKKELFEKYGLYDERLRIVSDWKFFLEVVGIKKCSTKYLDKTIIVFDSNGISFTNIELREMERRLVLEQFLPKYIVDDYLIHMQLNELFNHSFSRNIIGLLYRIVVAMEKKGLIHRS